MGVMTIPVLPCISMDETLGFYRALGFEVTLTQTRPNVYLATRRGDVHLHFMGMEKLDPASAYTTCLVIVPEVEDLHRTFADALRQVYGRVPVSGRPRMSRMKPGQSRFTVVDVAGNSLIFIREQAPQEEEPYDGPETDSRLARALRTAGRLRDFRNDDGMAAKVLDVALRKERGEPLDRARALAARAELAVALGEDERALLAELDGLPLTAADRDALRPALDAVEALRRGQVTS